MFKVGDRVRLPPDEYSPEEFGEVESVEARGMFIVRIDECHRNHADDGLRELHFSQMEAM